MEIWNLDRCISKFTIDAGARDIFPQDGHLFPQDGHLRTPVPVPVLSQIEAGQKGYYVNIHNQKYPGGAVRAQL